MFDPIAYRNELANRLTTMAACYEVASAAMAQLSGHLDCRGNIPYPRDAIQQILHGWVDDILNLVSEAFKGDSDASITKDRRFPSHFVDVECKSRRLTRLMRDDSASISEIVQVFLSEYDFANFAKWLKSRAEALEAEGISAAADHIANAFGLNASHGRARPPSFKAGRFQFERTIYCGCSYSGYSYDHIRSLRQLTAAFAVMESTIGVDGAMPSLHAITEAFSEAKTALPSRTTFCKETKLSATVYNGKMVFGLTPEIADATLAFLAMHATVSLVGAKQTKAA